MATLAVVGVSLCAQVRENTADLQGLDILCLAGDVTSLRQAMVKTQADILLLDLDQLGSGGQSTIAQLQQQFHPKSVLVAYDFARRETVRALQAMDGVRTLRKPLGMGTLKLFLMSFITRDILKSGATPPPGTPMTVEPEAPRRFSDEQLGRLQEISSGIQCECPNHVSSVVQTLTAFEAYSKRCENKNDADAAMHRTLWEKTMQARVIMEDALAQLVAFEKINL